MWFWGGCLDAMCCFRFEVVDWGSGFLVGCSFALRLVVGLGRCYTSAVVAYDCWFVLFVIGFGWVGCCGLLLGLLCGCLIFLRVCCGSLGFWLVVLINCTLMFVDLGWCL